LELETLHARRKINDIAQVYKLVHGADKTNKITLFRHVPVPEVRTRLAADPLNIRPEQSRTDIRRNFLSQRVAAGGNKIEQSIKNSKNVKCFKAIYRRLTKITRWKAVKIPCRKTVRGADPLPALIVLQSHQ
jgi:hypothetical protein